MKPVEQEQLERELQVAEEVKKLKSKFLDNFFRVKEEQIFATMKELPLGSVDDLQTLHMMLKSINSLQDEVNTVMNTGKMASLSLSQELDKAST